MTGLELAEPHEIRAADLSEKAMLLPKVFQSSDDLPYNLRASFRATTKLAPRNTEQAMQFLKLKKETDSSEYYRRCLVLQREARGIPAVYPTAFAAMEATPESERVYKLSDLRRGMVAFSDDLNDSNTAGHVYGILGRNKEGRILCYSNDVKKAGHVDVVYIDFFKNKWGDPFQFGATMLNGYDFADFNKPAKPVKNFNTLGDRYAEAIEELKRIRRNKQKKGADKVVKALTRNINMMEKHYAKFSN